VITGSTDYIHTHTVLYISIFAVYFFSVALLMLRRAVLLTLYLCVKL